MSLKIQLGSCIHYDSKTVISTASLLCNLQPPKYCFSDTNYLLQGVIFQHDSAPLRNTRIVSVISLETSGPFQPILLAAKATLGGSMFTQ
jgi:hypothetical protein